MLGYMSEVSLARTLEERKVTFFSRSRGELWQKGETSGATLDLVSLHVDCDQDTILLLANPQGPTCHKGTESCFGEFEGTPDLGFLATLEKLIERRKGEAASAAENPSYTVSLLRKGTKRVAQKVGEEGVETALAALAGDQEELVNEAADLLYHLLVLLASRELTLGQVIGELGRRHQR